MASGGEIKPLRRHAPDFGTGNDGGIYQLDKWMRVQELIETGHNCNLLHVVMNSIDVNGAEDGFHLVVGSRT